MSTFFQNQQAARRNTKLLVLLYLLAVAGVIVAVDAVLAAVWLYSSSGIAMPRAHAPGVLALAHAVPPRILVLGALGTGALILAVSGWHIVQLSGGGDAVARMAAARRVATDTRDPLERRLVNVVEEMAIASGVRVPAVYVMDGEAGINAFAAGYEVSNAIVAATRGALESLNRDELQGVVGHEFSHIVNGDMRLNIRMIGVLAGIVFIGAIGNFLLRSQRGSRDSKGAAPIFAAGLALLLIGYVGLFFARLIKAAVSRQREFLADASSVQFTRNPDGIAGALDQIGLSAQGAFIASHRAEDLSHMFFGQAIHVQLHGLFDTHPPLEERIERASPRFDRASYRKSRRPAAAGVEAELEGSKPGAPAAAAGAEAGRRGADIGTQWGRSAVEAAALVGALDSGKVDYAARLLAALPAGLRERLRDAEQARAVVVALLLAPADEVMRSQLASLEAAGLQALAARAREAAPLVAPLGAGFRLPVIDLALPAIKGAPEAARQELLRALELVIHADRRVSLHEFVVLTLARSQLAPLRKPGAVGRRKLAELRPQALVVLSLVARAGTRRDAPGEALASAMRAGTAQLRWPEAPAAAGVSLEAASAALEALQELAPLEKAILVKALFAAVTDDGVITVAQAELMRLVGAVLDCPLPPLLATIDPAKLAA